LPALHKEILKVFFRAKKHGHLLLTIHLERFYIFRENEAERGGEYSRKVTNRHLSKGYLGILILVLEHFCNSKIV
jgi:hypothetical protein